MLSLICRIISLQTTINSKLFSTEMLYLASTSATPSARSVLCEFQSVRCACWQGSSITWMTRIVTAPCWLNFRQLPRTHAQHLPPGVIQVIWVLHLACYTHIITTCSHHKPATLQMPRQYAQLQSWSSHYQGCCDCMWLLYLLQFRTWVFSDLCKSVHFLPFDNCSQVQTWWCIMDAQPTAAHGLSEKSQVPRELQLMILHHVLLIICVVINFCMLLNSKSKLCITVVALEWMVKIIHVFACDMDNNRIPAVDTLHTDFY